MHGIRLTPHHLWTNTVMAALPPALWRLSAVYIERSRDGRLVAEEDRSDFYSQSLRGGLYSEILALN